MPLHRLLILPALAVLLTLAVPASPASAIAPQPTATCPCWEAGGPFYTPVSWCYDLGSTRFGFQPGTFAQTVTYGAVSYCRKNGFFGWTSPAQHAACNDSLHVACSPILAVAYIDRNDNDVFDRPDGLIAKLVDTDGNGADAGDVLVADEYPLVAGANAPTGRFRVKTKHCSLVDENDVRISCEPAGQGFLWSKGDDVDQFAEFSGFATPIFLLDVRGTGQDVADVQATSELDPNPPTSSTAPSTDDDNFIDVYVRP